MRGCTTRQNPLGARRAPGAESSLTAYDSPDVADPLRLCIPTHMTASRAGASKGDRVHFLRRVGCICFIALAASTPARAQGYPYGDWGDAPGGMAAYWDNGVAGFFPTCDWSPGGFIYHSPDLNPLGIDNCFFGNSVDYELNGNGGLCSEPYDVDECNAALDGDAGLRMPTAYTYGPSHQLITCSGLPTTNLGFTCGTARWGRDIDISIANAFQFPVPAYLNVMIDWDRDGQWSVSPVGPVGCGYTVPEHVIKNHVVPAGFFGLASTMGLADFPVGPDSGVVWVRFTISPTPVPYPYEWPYIIEYGETEDYLLRVAPRAVPQELGDAPYLVRAYPPNGAIGKFPTCLASPGYVHHDFGGGLYLGASADPEIEGNQDNCGFTPHDNDECYGDGDAGLINPRPLSIDYATNSLVNCGANPGTTLGPSCTPIVWGSGLDIQITNNEPTPAFLNMLADWDRSGSWEPGEMQCQTGIPFREQVLTNLVVPGLYNGTLSGLSPPSRQKGQPGLVWVRFTLSSIAAPPDWTGGGAMGLGETEDYLLRVSGSVLDAPGSDMLMRVGEVWPNPARAVARLRYQLATEADVGITVHDVTGRQIHDAGVVSRAAGAHDFEWHGRDARGAVSPTGVYFIHVRIDGQLHTRRTVLIH